MTQASLRTRKGVTLSRIQSSHYARRLLFTEATNNPQDRTGHRDHNNPLTSSPPNPATTLVHTHKGKNLNAEYNHYKNTAAITQEKFLMIAGITCGVKVNWNRILFNILKDMVTPGSRQAKGYAIQISLLLKNVPNLELGESSVFPSSKILTEKTVHRYISLNDKVGGEEVVEVPRVKRTPVKRATSKKRPATDADAERVVKKKRTTKRKTGSAKETLETLPVEAVPLQMIAPIPVVPPEQPPVPKRKSQKRKRRLVLGSEDEIVDSEVATIRSEQLDFRAKAEENYLNLSTQLGDIVDFIRGGDAKKGEGSSSRPQPPPDDHSRPSGGTGGSGSGAQGQSRPGLGSGISQSKGNRSGSSKRRTSGDGA
ncbi:pre-mRNA-processing factor 39 [Dorcoceras hygrometricum]|uniref:Pre-mRNA-processing factor 39 n=1 Tax=Dorcoceras hygrometricum TaxID=472368 RepID=A0A2Z7CK15_9LAMI|nr:pre-mRNA-processing factor 39 [Dorcoceras hygrometricum]